MYVKLVPNFLISIVAIFDNWLFLYRHSMLLIKKFKYTCVAHEESSLLLLLAKWKQSTIHCSTKEKNHHHPREREKKSIKKVWRTATPSKFLVDKLPTRVALHQRGVISFNLGPTCVFCFRHSEDSEHLFFTWSYSAQIWSQVGSWLGINHMILLVLGIILCCLNWRQLWE